MNFKHHFTATLHWTSQQESPERQSTRISAKNHHIKIDGKAILEVSAAKAFKGDPTLYNPEDLLLSSLMSCHMMSYLYVCSQHHITVISYTDSAHALLETSGDGSGLSSIMPHVPLPLLAVDDTASCPSLRSAHH